jgi:hypothetical protein
VQRLRSATAYVDSECNAEIVGNWGDFYLFGHVGRALECHCGIYLFKLSIFQLVPNSKNKDIAIRFVVEPR